MTGRGPWRLDIAGMARRALDGAPRYGLALREATRTGDARMIGTLVEAGWSDRAQSTGETCLMMAARLGDLACVEALLPVSKPEAVDQSGMDALMHASAEGSRLCVARLAMMGANRSDKHGITALMYAASNGHWECVEELLEAGADPRSLSRYGETCLMVAAHAGCPRSVAALLPLSDLAAQDVMGRCALMQACLGPGDGLDLGSCVGLLLDAGFDASRANHHGRTALAIAASSGRIRAVEALLARAPGWDWGVDKEGLGPLDLAAANAVAGVGTGIVELLAARAMEADLGRAIEAMGAAAGHARSAGRAQACDLLGALALSARERRELGEADAHAGAAHAVVRRI